MTKYGKKIENRDLNLYIDSLKNKTYKLLPLREEKLQWEKHLETILIEISGFNSITLNQQVKIISVLSLYVLQVILFISSHRISLQFSRLGS